MISLMVRARRWAGVASVPSIPKFAQRSRRMLANFGIGTLAVEHLERGQKLVRGGGEIADPRTGRVVDGVDDRGGRAANAQLADALAAERTAVRIVLMQEDG